MTDFEIALNVLYAFRDNARDAARQLAPFVRGGTADNSTLTDWRIENTLDQTFTDAIEMILKKVEEEDADVHDDVRDGDGYTDAEADSYVLASAGYGTDEDYGYYGDSDY